MNTTSVDAWLADGCGRCDKYQTPACKVHLWTDALLALRALVLGAGLGEEMKWGNPTYTLDGKNVVMIVAFNASCCLSFFKGAAFQDPDGALELPGPNSHISRLLRFVSAAEVAARRDQIVGFLAQAIEAERAGVQVEKPAEREPMPEELAGVLAANPAVQAAFDALTPGRQRSYVLHVGSAKGAATRAARAGRCVEGILAGRGFNER